MAASKLLDTDLLLLQRPSSTKNSGRTSGDLFKISVLDIADYVEEQFDTDIVELKVEFEFLNQRLDFIENQILTSVNSTLIDHHYQIVNLEKLTGELVEVTENLQEQINAALSKAKINFYYQLVEDTDPKSGQMTALNELGEVAQSLDEVTKLVYNIRDEYDVVERFANVYDGEIIELTALNNVKSALTHRAVYSIDSIDFGFDTFTFHVTVRNASGTEMPFYSVGDGNLIRSDLYPIFTLSEEEIDDKLEEYLPLTGGTVTGELILSRDLQLNKNNAGVIKYNNTFKLIDNNNSVGFELSSGTIQIFRPIIMSGQAITGLARSTADDSAATVGYVKQQINERLIDETDLFSPGKPVASKTESSTESMGFYFTGGSLYFKA